MEEISLNGTHAIANLAQLGILATRLSEELLPGDVVLLSGELGAGKTTFTQYLGKALGITDPITSPTYTLVGEYVVTGREGINRLIHIDLYRTGGATVKGQSALNTDYVQDIFTTAKEGQAVVIVEWPEFLGLKISNRVWDVKIKSGKEAESRIITVFMHTTA